jgi:eukaryotic-like serine/threonine-protein kinase
VLTKLQPGDPAQVGPYRLTGVLGAGGMGRVFLGWSAGGRPVAVKVIKAELAADPEFRNRFRREVAAARTISGMYTALLLGTDLDGPVPWLATAYVDGPSLAEAVTSYGALPAGSVLALAAGVAEALSAIHAAGLVHRDLKPSNVLLASDGPRVIDFGISRAADTTTLTNTGVSIGSPGYLSPEQAIGDETGPPTDIFSLGAVLAFAASGSGPFGAGSLPALVYRVVHQAPALDGVPTELRPLILRCLQKRPEDRPTADDLLVQLADVQPGAQWLPEGISAALAAFAVSAPPAAGANGAPGADALPAAVAAGPEDQAFDPTETSLVRTDATPPAVTPVDGARRQGAGGTARRTRVRRAMRRGLVVPAVSALVAVAAVAVALASTLGRPGGTVALRSNGSPTASVSALPAAGHALTSAPGTPSPAHSSAATGRKTSRPTGQATRSGSPNQPAQGAPTTQAPPPVTQQPTTAAPQPRPTTQQPTTQRPTTQAPPPVTPSTSAPQPTLTPLTVFNSNGMTSAGCGAYGSVHSVGSDGPFTLVITDKTSVEIQVYWINGSGALVFYSDLGSNQSLSESTYINHYWFIANASGQCEGIFLVDGASTLTAA